MSGIPVLGSRKFLNSDIKQSYSFWTSKEFSLASLCGVKGQISVRASIEVEDREEARQYRASTDRPVTTSSKGAKDLDHEPQRRSCRRVLE
ncbi:hypothetical protein Y032_0135g1937 [Ancylostoma ceylanicum]|uniref:Uncharacterized protein n=1 Tax=Ancylostoma ceylanicum TaxID=53326 RepID=A0A016T5L8_9BILA|nr:hypothetical protein Y032_0135g1937 [Ancylostoma ceylanicum]